MDTAIIRPVSRSIQDCELTHMTRTPICHRTAQRQHNAYADSLRSLGVKIVELPPLHDQPDAVFVEDTAVVVDELAVLARPGAASRRAEIDSMADCIADFRDVVRIESPGTLEGGDIIQVGRRIFAGRSTRTNSAGIEQLRDYLAPFEYTVEGIPIPGALHLKTACTHIGQNTLLANSAWVSVEPFQNCGMSIIEVHPDEPFGGNAVLIGKYVLCCEQFPQTEARLRDAGFTLTVVNSTELGKAEGSLTCKSVLLNQNPGT
jgi:dimethylargininase